eukprot:3644502-Pleurochrysis_carterae.AAC.1
MEKRQAMRRALSRRRTAALRRSSPPPALSSAPHALRTSRSSCGRGGASERKISGKFVSGLSGARTSKICPKNGRSWRGSKQAKRDRKLALIVRDQRPKRVGAQFKAVRTRKSVHELCAS